LQRSRLLENTERLERSNRRLDEGYRVCIETGNLYIISHKSLSNLILVTKVRLTFVQ